MSVSWLILTGVVRALFLGAPFLNVMKEFAIPKEYKDEAQEYARAGACKAMILSFPAFEIINMLSAAEQKCGKVGVMPFPLAVIFLLCVVVATTASFVPAGVYRGKLRIYIIFLGITAIDIILTAHVIPSYITLICHH